VTAAALQQCEHTTPGSQITTTMVPDITVALVIPLVALLTSKPVLTDFPS
jgi:hypothetical protein